MRKKSPIHYNDPFRKDLRKQQIRAYITAFLAMLAFYDVFWLIYDAANRIPAFFIMLLLLFLYTLGAVFFAKKIFKNEHDSIDGEYDLSEKAHLRACSDKYTKRFFNSIAILIGSAFLIGGSEMILFIYGKAKPAELMECCLSYMVLAQISIYLLIKNLILHKVYMHRIKMPDPKRSVRYALGIAFFSLVYWILVILSVIVFFRNNTNLGKIFLIAAGIYAALIGILNVFLRKGITYKNLSFNPKRIITLGLVFALTALVFLQRDNSYTQSYIDSVSYVEHNQNKIEYDDDTGVYTITSSTEDFKILHLTDIHLGGSLSSSLKDQMALEACYEEILYTQPDLVIVTGDMCFPMGIMSLSLNNSAPVRQFAAFMEKTGIPWAFTYGNHDTESISTINSEQLDEVYRSLSYKTSGTLLYPYTQPDIWGRNNQLIEIRNQDGSLMTALFLIDSNAYTGEGLNTYDYIHDDQVEWYADEIDRLNREEGKTINSLVFFHIPLQEYKTATELYLEGSEEVKYYFGENPGDHGGITNELVCCSEYPSKMFDTALELGSTTGFFCGHDHYNNASLEYKGIRLTYGMSIDYLAMPGIEKETKQRGAELLTIHSDGTWDLIQTPLDMISDNKFSLENLIKKQSDFKPSS